MAACLRTQQLDHRLFERLRCEFFFLFLEPERDRCDNLKSVLDQFVTDRGGLPKGVGYRVEPRQFVEVADEIVTMLEEQQRKLAPTFAFIDPFGFSGVPIELISRLLAFDRCEVFFNLMSDHINRFATAGNVDQNLGDIFGSDEYRNAGALPPGKDRQAFILDLYEHQLKEIGGFPYVQRFQMFNQQGHNVYTLFSVLVT